MKNSVSLPGPDSKAGTSYSAGAVVCTCDDGGVDSLRPWSRFRRSSRTWTWGCVRGDRGGQGGGGVDVMGSCRTVDCQSDRDLDSGEAAGWTSRMGAQLQFCTSTCRIHADPQTPSDPVWPSLGHCSHYKVLITHVQYWSTTVRYFVFTALHLSPLVTSYLKTEVWHFNKIWSLDPVLCRSLRKTYLVFN